MECSVTTVMESDGQRYLSINIVTKTTAPADRLCLGICIQHKSGTVLPCTPKRRLHPLCSKKWAKLTKDFPSFTSQTTNINQVGHLINITRGEDNTQNLNENPDDGQT